MPPTATPRDPIQPKPIASPTAQKEEAIAGAVAEFNAILQRRNVPVLRDSAEGVEAINAAVREAIEFRLGPVRDTTAVDQKVLDQVDAFLHPMHGDNNITNPGQISLANITSIIDTEAAGVRDELCRKL